MEIFQLLAHLDQHILTLVQTYGAWIYLILFLIVFAETGLVVAPFLPGDSLLFVTGALAATGALQPEILIALLFAASFLGDNTNYWIGRYFGPRIFHSTTSRLLNRNHLEQTHAFYRKHGGKAIILARFFPIIRTFAPFVAGVGRMDYRQFISYSLVGGLAWVGFFVGSGYFFGNIPAVKQNLSLVMLGIIAVSLSPGIVHFLRQRLRGG